MLVMTALQWTMIWIDRKDRKTCLTAQNVLTTVPSINTKNIGTP